MNPTPSILHDICTFCWFYSSYLHVALTAKLEVANKKLAEEKTSQQVANQALWATQESNFALTRDLQTVRASTNTLKEELEVTRAFTTTTRQELSSKSMTLDELVVQEREA
jgi:hypothetical protein